MDREKAALWALERFLDLLATIPRKRMWRFAEVAGKLWYRLDKRHRRIALDNLAMAYGDELTRARREEIARGVFDHLARVIFELPYLRTLSLENLDEFITFSGVENSDAALRKNKGLLVMTTHFGNWEMMALGFSMKHHPFNVVVRPLDNAVLDKAITDLRSRGGNRMIPKSESVKE
ncbi:MAG: lysophospholipid acyltransferase family protein, partial [Acidobacteriota bacterium]